MVISQKLRELREAKNLSQGDIEKRTGLLRCYTSRVENGHTVPSVETLEKYAKALEVPLYQLFHDGTEAPKTLRITAGLENDGHWGAKGADRMELRKFAVALSRMNERERKLLFTIAATMARPNRRPSK